MVFLLLFRGFGGEKQSHFISVQCSAFSGQHQDEEKEFEKTKPILYFTAGNAAFTQ